MSKVFKLLKFFYIFPATAERSFSSLEIKNIFDNSND